ncbi:hypothetical protein C8R46DRAFT_1321598 [Mycena filopes]|nr:hypothetical protein C8R46DRAFT_1321598 [Mycena filopes]
MNSKRATIPAFLHSWGRLCAVLTGFLIVLWFTVPRSARPALVLTPQFDDALAKSLGHPTFAEAREYERNLPQHIPPALLTKSGDRPRYLFLKDASWGSGWNNVFQEALLNTHLAYLSHRSYVFPAYIARDHPPFPDTLADGRRHWLHIPMNAFVAGPTAGGPLSEDGTDPLLRRAVSEEWWNTVCPKEEVTVLKLHDTNNELGLTDKTEGAEVVVRWANKLRTMSAPCVSVEGDPVLDFYLVGSHRILSLWPTYSIGPVLKYFSWSPLITQVLFRNFHILSSTAAPAALSPSAPPPRALPSSFSASLPPPPTSPFRSFSPYRASEPPIAGLLGLHVRRGDFQAHCVRLADAGWEYNAWNLLGTPAYARAANGTDDPTWPALPDHLDARAGESRRDAALRHCWPSTAAIVQRVSDVRALSLLSTSTRGGRKSAPLNRIFIATDAPRPFVLELTAHLQAEGWEAVFSSHDLELVSLEERAVAQAIDMSVLVAAEEFVGVGFSSLSSNVVQLRLAGGREARTIHFW